MADGLHAVVMNDTARRGAKNALPRTSLTDLFKFFIDSPGFVGQLP
jgi:hypothetical protein